MRLRRFGFAALCYALSAALVAAGWAFDMVSASTALEMAAAILAVNLGLYAIFRSGFNLRFEDPSLTCLQILVAITVLMQFIYHLDVARNVALLACFIIFLFGVFSLNAREFTVITLYTLAAYALVINLLMQLRPQAIQNVFLEWISWLTLAGILPCFAAIGVRINALRLKLREREAGLRRAQVMAELAHVVTGPDGFFESWSETLPQLIGVDSAGMPKSTREWLELIHPDDRALFRNTSIDADRHGTRMSVEYRIRHEDGAWIHVSQVMEPIDAPADTTAKMRWFNTLQDVTGQKQGAAALQASEERHRAMFEHAAVGIIHSALDGAVQMVNPKFCDMVGYTRAEVIQLTALDLICPEDVEKSLSGQSQLLSGTRAPYELELRLLRKDRSEIWVHVTTSLMRAADGRPSYLISVVNDISGRKQADDRIRRLNRIYAVLSGINAAIVRIRDRTELFQEACRIAVEAGRLTLSYIYVVDPAEQRLTPVASAGADAGFLEGMRNRLSLRDDAPDGHGPAARAVREKRVVVVNDVENDPQIRYKKEHAKRGIRSVAILPLFVSGEPVGVLGLHSSEVGFFDEEEMKLLHELAGDIAFALDHLEKAQKLDYLAFYDSLTGLANRTLFLDRLKQAIHAAAQSQGKFALVLADIERLRTVNESLGRHAGDALLSQVAERLARVAGRAEVGRISADQFAVVLPTVKGRSEAGRIVQTLMHACFNEPFALIETKLKVSAKAGIALHPNDGGDAETLLKHAEAALRKGKEAGERFAFYTPDLTERTVATLTLENKLRQALDNEEFVLHYQPKVDLEMRRIVGVEALIRWQSPELGLVPPMKFIPLMEETGMILEAGAWALRRAAIDHRSWVEQRLQAPRVAVNVSAIQLRQRDFVGAVEQAIIEGVAPTGIDLEITESLIMEDVQGSIEKLKAVRGLGVRIAIDDFGTGYSSLGYLAKLPVQTLKIDRSFIITMLNDPDTMTLVQTMISLAHSLRLTVVAEGVDAEEQAKTLRLLRCDEMQGYLFSKPIPFAEMSALLKQGMQA